MTYEANTPEEYVEQLPEDRKQAVQKIRQSSKKIFQKVLKKVSIIKC